MVQGEEKRNVTHVESLCSHQAMIGVGGRCGARVPHKSV
jgi:hypothetical protein